MGLQEYSIPDNMLNRKDYVWDDKSEPHVRRRVEILNKYPQIKELFGPDSSTKYLITSFVVLQLLACYLVKDASWPVFLLVAYIVGGTLNHSCTTAIHETTHGLVFDKAVHNYLMAIFVNLPMGIPVAMSFKKYHHEHHQYQGVDGIDTDIGTFIEANYFNSKIRKFFNVVFLSLFYGLRPVLVNPKAPSMWEIINIAAQGVFDAAIVYFWGWSALVYFLLSTFLGLGLHPCSGHFIQEHFVTAGDAQETYSYYGPLNSIMLNVGYHNEHHDFPRIPGSKLPLLRKIAPEYYENITYKTSYLYTIYEYIFTDGYGHYNRVKRSKNDHDRSRREVLKKYSERAPTKGDDTQTESLVN